MFSVEITVFGSVNILLALTLLVCPYVCLGQKTQGGCGDPTGLDSCEPDLGQKTKVAQSCDCCLDETVAEPESLPVDRTPATPEPLGQCLCQGALADAVNRPNEIAPVTLLPAVGSSHFETAPSRSRFDGFEESGSRNQTGRDVYLTLCALLL